ncbi:hypothetical protein NT239_12310 [Chitinibacter sp. SCUT-21]|uniref:hypothetical protein n=1 Tax=Chitinibacter sp. SCUT-21 TaxID=2970891 RepID=UPI0035A580F3
MSEETAAPDEESHTPNPVVADAPGFLQKYRWHLIGAGAFLLVVIFFMAGVAVGMSKRGFEKKFYLDQIAKLKVTLSSAVERQEELRQEIKELKIDLRAKKDHVAELEDKVAAFERKSEKSAEPAAHGAVKSEASAQSAESGDPGLDYVRMKAGDCVVDGSAGATANKWKECLQKAKK